VYQIDLDINSKVDLGVSSSIRIRARLMLSVWLLFVWRRPGYTIVRVRSRPAKKR